MRSRQTPLKELYRVSPERALVALAAAGEIDLASLTCRVKVSHVLPNKDGSSEIAAGVHTAAGGDGQAACSGDMLLQSLVACSGVTFAAVATAMELPILQATVEASAKMDFRGTLGVSRDIPVGLLSLQMHFAVTSKASDEALSKLLKLTERYCVVLQSLSPSIEVSTAWSRVS